MRRNFMTILAAIVCATALGQPRYDYARLKTERLDRGVVAVKQTDGKVAVLWRILRDDRKGEPFDVYRNGEKLNNEPLQTGGSMFIDEQPLSGDATYEVRGGVATGSCTLQADAPQGYLPVKIEKPANGRTPDGRQFSYSANDATVADVDGDGTYEIILKWDPSNARDNAHDGFTGPTLFDCYRLSGERLWRINMGPNIRSGAHYVPFIAYDLDGDGRAELLVKTADGTIDGTGTVLGDSTADYRHGAREALAKLVDGRNPEVEKQEAEMQKMRQEWEQMRRNGQTPNRRDMMRRMRGRGAQTAHNEGRILSGPESITVFDGLTGRALDTKPYMPERGELKDWGDTRGNRSERYLAGVGYFGGTTASAFFCRGYYTRTVIAAWDWDGHELKSRWIFDTNTPEWASYAGQGNHNLRVADVDGDGYDEITYGSMAVDNDGRGLYNTGFGHGDAIHLTAFDPTTDELQVWDCHENKRDGSDFRDARTGKVLFQIKSKTDVGRAMAADIDPTNPGVEMWSTDSHGIRNIKGDVVSTAKDANDPQHDNTLVINGKYLPVNFGIWWDGDLLRELLDHETVSKFNWKEKTIDVVQKLDGSFNNGTKSNPCLQADVLGDWREEVIMRDRESTELRIYVSTIPTSYRINCLMQDIPYRLSVAAENVGYNQPPETGFYLGPDRTDYVK
jgi:rhamnogalacturonan endolyase